MPIAVGVVTLCRASHQESGCRMDGRLWWSLVWERIWEPRYHWETHDLYHGKASGLFDPMPYLRGQAPAVPTLCCTPSESDVLIVEASYPHVYLANRVTLYLSCSLPAAYSSHSSPTSQFSALHEQIYRALLTDFILSYGWSNDLYSRISTFHDTDAGYVLPNEWVWCPTFRLVPSVLPSP